jgi:hypothetical protein
MRKDHRRGNRVRAVHGVESYIKMAAIPPTVTLITAFAHSSYTLKLVGALRVGLRSYLVHDFDDVTDMVRKHRPAMSRGFSKPWLLNTASPYASGLFRWRFVLLIFFRLFFCNCSWFSLLAARPELRREELSQTELDMETIFSLLLLCMSS